MIRMWLVFLSLAIGLSALGGEPLPAGPFPMRSGEFLLRDGARNRSVAVVLVAPEGDRPVPWVAFSPGFLLSGRAYWSTAEILASHGIAVALLTSDVNLFTAGHRVLVRDLRFALGAERGGEVRFGTPCAPGVQLRAVVRTGDIPGVGGDPTWSQPHGLP